MVRPYPRPGGLKVKILIPHGRTIRGVWGPLNNWSNILMIREPGVIKDPALLASQRHPFTLWCASPTITLISTVPLSLSIALDHHSPSPSLYLPLPLLLLHLNLTLPLSFLFISRSLFLNLSLPLALSPDLWISLSLRWAWTVMHRDPDPLCFPLLPQLVQSFPIQRLPNIYFLISFHFFRPSHMKRVTTAHLTQMWFDDSSRFILSYV